MSPSKTKERSARQPGTTGLAPDESQVMTFHQAAEYLDCSYATVLAEGIDASESVDSVIKTVIHHPHKWDFVFQDAAHLFKSRFTFVRESPPNQVSSELRHLPN